MKMDSLIVDKAQADFDKILLQVQQAPVQIIENGKPVAVIISADEYEHLDTLKLQVLQLRAAKAQADIEAGSLSDGDSFMRILIKNI